MTETQDPGGAALGRLGLGGHGVRRLRVFRSLSRRDRHHRRAHERRVVAVAGLVDRRPGWTAPEATA